MPNGEIFSGQDTGSGAKPTTGRSEARHGRRVFRGAGVTVRQSEEGHAARPEAFFISGLAQDVALIARQARAVSLQNASGEPTIFLGADAWDNPVLLDGATAEVEGSYFSGHFSPRTDEAGARAFIDAYEAANGTPPGGGDAVSYDAVKLLMDAVDRAGRFDAGAIRDRLAATRDYAGATRIARFNEDRHPTKSAVILTIRNGRKRFFKEIDPGL